MTCPVCGNPRTEDSLGSTNAICAACLEAATTQLEASGERASRNEPLPSLPERFEPGELLGQGSFGIVRKCWDRLLRRHVAIKSPRLRAGQRDLLLREARAASNLDHPNIVRILDAGEYGGMTFVVSELVEGVTLKAWARDNPPDALGACRIVLQLAEGVQTAHSAGIVHRDLKPGNVMIDAAGTARILDFGLSRSLQSAEDTVMRPGQPIGTPAFMSPEQVRGLPEEIDERTDIYSLGVILFQLLTAHLPYEGSATQVMQQVARGSGPSPDDRAWKTVPAPLRSICERAMHRNRECRYSSAAALASDLRGYLDGRRLAAHPGWYQRRIVASFRRSGPWLAGLAAVLLLGFAAWREWSRPHHADPRQMVVLSTSPAGAQLAWHPVDPDTGFVSDEPLVRSIAGETARLPPGFYCVRARHQEGRLDVFRTVPANPAGALMHSVMFQGVMVPLNHRSAERDSSRIRLPGIVLVRPWAPLRPMAFIPGGTVSIPFDPQAVPLVSGQSRALAALLMDREEIRWRELLGTWSGLTLPPGLSEDAAATGIPWDVAVQWCELDGSELPTVWDYCLACTNSGGTTYPWGDEAVEDAAETVAAGAIADWDQSLLDPQLKGLLTGPDEWTATVQCDLINVEGRLEPLEPGASTTDFPQRWYVVDGSGRMDPGELRIRRKLWYSGNRLENSGIGFRAVRRPVLPPG